MAGMKKAVTYLHRTPIIKIRLTLVFLLKLLTYCQTNPVMFFLLNLLTYYQTNPGILAEAAHILSD